MDYQNHYTIGMRVLVTRSHGGTVLATIHSIDYQSKLIGVEWPEQNRFARRVIRFEEARMTDNTNQCVIFLIFSLSKT
jgi:hypothetical protein